MCAVGQAEILNDPVDGAGVGIALRGDRYVLHPVGGEVRVGAVGLVGQAGLFAGAGVAFWIILILILMLLSSLLWAIIYCKPGCCACCARYAFIRYFFFWSSASSFESRLVKEDAAHQADFTPLMASAREGGFSATYNYTLNVDQSVAARSAAAANASAANGNGMASDVPLASAATFDTWDKQAFATSTAAANDTLASAAPFSAAPDVNAYNSMRPSTYELNQLGQQNDEAQLFSTMASRTPRTITTTLRCLCSRAFVLVHSSQ